MAIRKTAGTKVSEGLSREQVIAAAEDVFRRFGPAKTTVVDVAKVLGMSHGNVYRHFKSKVALRNAVIEVWLNRFADALAKIVDGDGPALEKLRRWFDTYRALKTNTYRRETELFATYHELAQESAPVLSAYYNELARQLETIIASGTNNLEFDCGDPAATARAILDATTLFHNPLLAYQWNSPDIDQAFDRVWHLVLYGIAHSSDPKRS
jgi:AcrR family transcriptional regulator